VDVLADVLRQLRVEGSVQGRLELGAPWGFYVDQLDSASFHILLRGSAYLRLDGELTALSAGDLALFPSGSPHALVDSPDTLPISEDEVRRVGRPHSRCGVGCERIHVGGEGAQSTLICGRLKFDSPESHPLLAVLPKLIVVRGENGQAAPWLDQTLRLISVESTSEAPGAQIALDRLMDLLFIYTVRAWLSQVPAGDAGWLGALRDSRIGGVLQRIHAEPAASWTVESLARTSGMSRSGFAARFSDLVGESPLRYVTSWRMRLAAKLLLDQSDSSVADIASQVGYESEPAFGVVFKRHFESPPARWRRERLSPELEHKALTNLSQ